ncbi:PASTA domain-containing protein [Bifidobacterium miconisargentati]|uniref:PASTA domain-containing protein n=1 Tax=Bifidobacterium miconisargentati TaxID=2834437 RepID=UPI001BDCFE4D|nr:zinc-ribbon domain-containing protein [Bifidobacterium miconisargentati]MBW3090052.1 serine/threonine protein kinase [Bifidobacterium miconisargentati]
MRYCTECGAGNEPDSKHCIMCGAPLDTAPSQPSAKSAAPTGAGPQTEPGGDTRTLHDMPAPPSHGGPATAVPGPVPMPPMGGTPEPAPVSDGTGDATAVASVRPDRRRAIIIAILAAVLAICVVVAGVAAWNVFGPKTVPEISVKTASDAVSQLEGRGFKVVRKKQYDGAKKGSYLGLDGVKAGDRVSPGQPVTVLESAGPGVPQGTVGMTASQAEQSLSTMGVTVTEHEVVSDKPGHVAITTPADGDPVTDVEDGIHLGVGVEGEGIPVEIAGQDMNDAQSELEDKGYTVTMEPRFSSRQYLGKVVGANPAIGLKTDVKDVTLYYGVDASKRYDVLTRNEDGWGTVAVNAYRLAGEYCTDGGDCLTLEQDPDDTGRTIPSGKIGMTGKDTDTTLNLCPYSQNPPAGCAPSNKTDDSFTGQAMANYLISGDTGGFELHAGDGFPSCGDTVFYSGGGVMGYHCDNGTVADGMGTSTGLTYKPDEFLLYMPVDANLKTLESDGYFDGKTTYTPDKDRPYIIRRDNAKYTDFSKSFIPSYAGKAVAFKDAPNKSNVYYLVEKPVDWTLIDGTTVDKAKTKTETKTEGAGSAEAETKQDDQAMARLAGTYMMQPPMGTWHSAMVIKADGTFAGVYNPGGMGGGPTKFTGKFTNLTAKDDGTYTMDCEDYTITEGDNGDATGLIPCGSFAWHPKGSEASLMTDHARGWLSYDTPSNGPLPRDAITNLESQQETTFEKQES